jgi:hypothetical protein
MKTVKRYFTGMRRMWYLLAALFILVVSDGLISHFLITGGFAREGNPFLVPLVGEGNFLILKVVGGLICVFILWDIYKQRPKMALISSSCLIALYTGIVLWNIYIFFTR